MLFWFFKSFTNLNQLSPAAPMTHISPSLDDIGFERLKDLPTGSGRRFRCPWISLAKSFLWNLAFVLVYFFIFILRFQGERVGTWERACPLVSLLSTT